LIQRLKSLLDRLKWVHVFVIAGAGAAFFYYMQDNSDIESKEQGITGEKGNIAQLEHKIQEAKEFERQFDEKKKKYAELVKQLQDLKEALPRAFFLPDLLSDVLREAKQLELEVTRVQPDQKEEIGDLYNTLGFTIEVRGSFVQIFILLDRLAHMQRLLNVENFTLLKDSTRPTVTLGGAEGAFAGTSLSGGRLGYVGLGSVMRILTYRYRGGAAAPSPAPGGKK
jgi:Tfp pilus assembly protein PilO